jgi:hypothetical protein
MVEPGGRVRSRSRSRSSRVSAGAGAVERKRFGRWKPVTIGAASGIPKPARMSATTSGSGGGGEGEYPFGPEVARDFRQLQVVRSEVVTPLGDAVRFIDCEERDADTPKLLHEALIVEALRGDVQHPK